MKESVRKIIKTIINEVLSEKEMKDLWYVQNAKGSVLNISTSKDGADNFLRKSLKDNGTIFYVQVPIEDWNSEKVSISNISHYAKKLYRESYDENKYSSKYEYINNKI